MVVVYMAERLNSLAARHWHQFAGQNYFDPGGVFLSAVLSAPLVFTMFVILVGLRTAQECSGVAYFGGLAAWMSSHHCSSIGVSLRAEDRRHRCEQAQNAT